MSDILDLIDHAIDALEAWPDAMRWVPERHEPQGEGNAASALVEWAAQHGYLLEWQREVLRAYFDQPGRQRVYYVPQIPGGTGWLGNL